MMASFNGVAFLDGVVVPAATIEVRREDTGDLAQIYADADATILIVNPSAFADADGQFTFHVAGLMEGYSVEVSDGVNSRIWHNVAIGTAGMLDASTVGRKLVEASSESVGREAIGVSDAYAPIRNLALSCSVASNALTIALKTRALVDPSSTDRVRIPFRNVTAATGDFSVVEASAAHSLVIPSTATMGASNATAFRLWVVSFNDGGTLRLGVINCLSGTNIFPLKDDDLRSSTAIGTGSDSAHVIYTGAAVTSKAMRVLGYIEWSAGLTTAGTWSIAPTKVQIGPGVPLPGQTVQEAISATGAAATGTTTIPFDDTIPQNTEGDQYLSQAITPTAAPNVLHIESQLAASQSASADVTQAALFRDSTAGALASAMSSQAPAGSMSGPTRLCTRILAGTTSATTFKVRAGGTTGTMTLNGAAGARKHGGVLMSFLSIREIMA